MQAISFKEIFLKKEEGKVFQIKMQMNTVDSRKSAIFLNPHIIVHANNETYN